MNRREAKRRVCLGALRILNSAADQDWLRGGRSMSSADARRMQLAFRELLDELARRADMVAYIDDWCMEDDDDEPWLTEGDK